MTLTHHDPYISCGTGEQFLHQLEMLMGQARQLHIPDTFPLHMQASLVVYIRRRQRPYLFLLRVLENDLSGAMEAVDRHDVKHLQELARWIREHAPAAAAGSKENVRAWLERDGV